MNISLNSVHLLFFLNHLDQFHISSQSYQHIDVSILHRQHQDVVVHGLYNDFQYEYESVECKLHHSLAVVGAVLCRHQYNHYYYCH